MNQDEPKTSARGGTAACDRREEILTAATHLFAEQGFSDAVTQILADTLGVGKGTLYRHFPSKRALFLAAVDRVMTQLQEHVERATDDLEDGLERVRCGVCAYLQFFREHPEYVEILVQERAKFHDRDRPTYFEHRERNAARWRDLYRTMIGEGRLRPDVTAERIADVMSASLYGAMFLNDYAGRSGAFSIDANSIIDILFRGILSDSERAASGTNPDHA
jgi:AcrR family transcriptional regulator